MRTDEQVAAAAERTADITLRLVRTTRERDRARTIATLLEAENHAILEAAQNLISNYIGLCCDVPDCDCPLARLARLTTHR